MCCPPSDPVDPSIRIFFTCPCGLQRCLPAGIRSGDTFALETCLKCGSPFLGRYLGIDAGVEQLSPKEFYEHS